jgi:hypothetical protein
MTNQRNRERKQLDASIAATLLAKSQLMACGLPTIKGKKGRGKRIGGSAVLATAAANKSQKIRLNHSDPISQYRGVCWDKARGKWRAQLTNAKTGKVQYLGCFPVETEAVAAYAEAAAAEPQPPGSDPVSKYRGVSWVRKQGKWGARIRINGKQQHLGR